MMPKYFNFIALKSNFASTAANQFLIRAGGGVGIGTTQPLAKLHVLEINTVVAARFESARDTCAIRLNATGVGGREWNIESTGPVLK